MFKVALLFIVFFVFPAFSAQEAVVMSDQAIVYADLEMRSPIGFIKQGKKIKIGEIARNKAQVYPIIVSGKIAFIKVSDVSTAKENFKSNQLVAERFIKSTQSKYESNYSLGYFQYASQVSLDEQNGQLLDKDSVAWNGVSFKGEVIYKETWGMQILLNFLNSEEAQEQFRAIELGVGGSYLFLDSKRVQARFFGQALAIPFSSYSLDSDFRVNGYGYTLGGGLGLSYYLTNHWGVEGSGGFYYTQLMGFNTPDPYQSISPSFLGSRLGVSVNYRF